MPKSTDTWSNARAKEATEAATRDPSKLAQQGNSMNQIAQKRNREYYNKYGKYYEKYHAYFRNPLLMRQWRGNLEEIKDALPTTEGNKAIDCGCGTGLLTLMLLRLGFSVTAVDISKVMLAELQKKVNHLPGHLTENLRVVHGGIETLETFPKSSFHVVCESSVMHHLDDYIPYLNIANELLIPGGVVYIGREPLHVKEQRVHKINVPLYALICLIDILCDKFQSRTNVKEVRDESITPQREKGGVSAKAFIELGEELEMRVLFRRLYNWHRSPQAFFLDNILPRSLRYEKLWGTFFDLALQKSRDR